MKDSENGFPPADTRISGERQRLQRVYDSYASEVYQRRWSLNLSANRTMHDDCTDHLDRMLTQECIDLSGARVLDIGCGSGRSMLHWLDLKVPVGNLFGSDILAERLRSAPDDLKQHMVCGEGHRLPFHDSSFDCVSAFTMFSSVLQPALRRAIAKQIERIVAPDGLFICYDLRIPSPRFRSLRPVTLSQLHRLFPYGHMRSETLTVLPPLARRVAEVGVVYEKLDRQILHSHRLTLITFPSRQEAH